MNNLMYDMGKARQIELEQEAQQIYLVKKMKKADSEPLAVKWVNRVLNRLGNTLINTGAYLQRMANPGKKASHCQDC